MAEHDLFTTDHAAANAKHVKATGDRAYRPSNGSEGEMFFSRWCYRCTKDDYGAGKYCPIIGLSMALGVDDEGYPGEWIIGDDGQPRCTAFDRDWRKP